MQALDLIFYVAAAVCFAIAAWMPPQLGRLVAVGLLLFTLAAIF